MKNGVICIECKVLRNVYIENFESTIRLMSFHLWLKIGVSEGNLSGRWSLLKVGNHAIQYIEAKESEKSELKYVPAIFIQI